VTHRAALALIAGLIAAAACSIPGQQDELVIGAIYPISGPQGPGGREELAGVRAALRVAQARGLAGDRRVRLQVVDVQTPQGAAAAVDSLVDHQHAAAILGTYGSTLAEAAADRADQRRVFYLETGAVADAITSGHHYVFRTVATGSNLGRMAVEFTTAQLLPASGLQPGQARAVIVHTDDVYGRSVAAGQAAQAATAGLAVVDMIAYDPRTLDPALIARRIAQDRPDYLWDVSYLDDGVAIWHAVATAGIPLRGVVGTSSAFCMPAFGERLGREAVGVFAADKPDDQLKETALDASARELLAQARVAYKTETGEAAMPIGAVAGFVGGWNFFHDILGGVRGGVSGEALRAAAFAVDVPTGGAINGGGVKFAPAGAPDAGQNRRAAAVVGQWQAGPAMKVVYPAGYAEAAPILPRA
jgi:branched-chain amino acid transport system substrate-binding protein